MKNPSPTQSGLGGNWHFLFPARFFRKCCKLQRMYFCEATTWIWAVRHLGVGSWDPLVRQKWRQIWKLRLRRRRFHNILLYNIYTRRFNMPSGVHTIFAHAPSICVLTIICLARGDLAGEQTRAATDLGRCSVLRQDMGRHYAPGAGHPFFKISLFQELLQSKKM